MPTNAEAIAAVLRDAGVQRCFGHPGGEIVVFLEACRRAGIQFLLTGHEASAAFMADVTGQITGVPGLCASTLGPGATNLVTGVSNAFLDRSPVVAVTAQLSTQLDRSYTHQRLDLGRLFAPITKWSATINGYGTRAIAERAVSLARAPRRGPVHLALPSDLAGQPVRSVEPSEPLPDVPVLPGAPSVERLARAAAAITRAHRPAVVVGLGADPERTAEPLARFLAASGFPFFMTPKAKGIVDEADPRFIGIASGMAGDEVVLRVMQRCDLLIGVGFDPVECDKDWFVRQRFVALDEVGGADAGYQPEVEVIGAIPEALDYLASAISRNHSWEGDDIAAMREAVAESVRPRRPAPDGLSPYEVMHRLRQAWPDEGVVVCDVGAHKLLIGQVWRTARPGTFFMSNGLSSMGYGLPGAVAAKLIHPDRPVLCVTGDGGFLMVLHVLEFLVREAVPVVVAVLSDRTLAAIKVSQRRRELTPYGVDFGHPDFAAVATAFGAVGRRVDRLDEVAPATAQAMALGRPVVLDIAVDPDEYMDQI
jgi:acetolactate synthase-1/2/3 large subunit